MTHVARAIYKLQIQLLYFVNSWGEKILDNTRLDTSLGNQALKAKQKVQIYKDTFPPPFHIFWFLYSYKQMTIPEGTPYS